MIALADVSEESSDRRSTPPWWKSYRALDISAEGLNVSTGCRPNDTTVELDTSAMEMKCLMIIARRLGSSLLSTDSATHDAI